MKFRKPLFLASNNKIALEQKKELINMTGEFKPEDADVIIVLGGDGFMLHCLHNYLHLYQQPCTHIHQLALLG